jgi:hypothetical protein
MPTISEEQAQQIRQQLEENQRLRQALQGAQELWNDPQLGREAKALWKKKWPDAQIDGFDQEQRLNEIVTDFDKKREDEKKEAAIKERADRLASQREEVRQRGNYTDDGMKNLEKMMQERDIIDYEAGDLLFRQKNPPPSDGVSDVDSHYMNYDRHPAAQELARDPERWGFNELVKAVERDAKQRQRF